MNCKEEVLPVLQTHPEVSKLICQEFLLKNMLALVWGQVKGGINVSYWLPQF
jgi:hypothetical protein